MACIDSTLQIHRHSKWCYICKQHVHLSPSIYFSVGMQIKVQVFLVSWHNYNVLNCAEHMHVHSLKAGGKRVTLFFPPSLHKVLSRMELIVPGLPLPCLWLSLACKLLPLWTFYPPSTHGENYIWPQISASGPVLGIVTMRTHEYFRIFHVSPLIYFPI